MLSLCNIRKIFIGLLFSSVVTCSLFAQSKSIGGVINQYVQVVSIDGINSITVTNASAFHSKDTVLLIQMKGAIMNVTGSYGLYQGSNGSPGSYEFMIIQSVSTNSITFTRQILNTYDVRGLVQLVRVPYYNSASVDSKLTCAAWDSTAKTGGVLALIVGGSLSLNADIDVEGKGFAGGKISTGTGICITTNPLVYDLDYYSASYTNSGFKGEGLAQWENLGSASLYPEYAKGKGHNFTGGGGGNGRFSGGGGGAGTLNNGNDYGTGGYGGREVSTCLPAPPGDGGSGGAKENFGELNSGIFLGSGGGSSTYEVGSTATPGGNGGGIIIIVTDTLKGNGHTIKADGATPATSTIGNAGAGGGGGGGSVAIYLQSFSTQSATSALTISSKGGKGGDATNNLFGEGGGGGGGLVYTNNLTYPANVVPFVTEGSPGKRKTGGTAQPGKPGQQLTSFIPVLNGFLFNAIVDSVTNNKLDSVCSNMRPPKIIGTTPIGSSTTFTWQDSTALSGSWNDIPGYVNNQYAKDYQPPYLSVTTSFRRIVHDNGSPPIVDYSWPVKIIVHQAISNNITGNPAEVCLNGNPPLIQQLLPDLIVPASYRFYEWQDSSSVGTWGSSVATTKDYDPPAPLAVTTWYRRTVRSGSCVDSTSKVKMTVLPLIANNTIGSPQDICYGSAFNNLLGTDKPDLTGGNNIFTFKWESKINSVSWITASGVNNQKNYNPAEQPQRVPTNEYDFRRIVFSGNSNVCADTSAVIHLRDFPKITNNTITIANKTICSGSVPDKITGSLPVNGNGVFTYTWQDSTNSSTQWQNIAGYVNSSNRDYQPPALSVTTSFRRIALSYPCDSVSNSIRIVVQPPVTNNNIYLKKIGGSSDTTICNGQVHDRLIGTTITGGSYQWLYSAGPANPTAITGATQVNYLNPPALNVTTNYKRLVKVGVCSDTTDPGVTINVLPPISNYEISAGQSSVCENKIPEPVSGQLPAGGSGSYIFKWQQSTDGGASWSDAEGTNSLVSYQPPALANPTIYRRVVISGPAGCCSVTSSEVAIGINPAPKGPVNAGPDASIYSMDRTYIMNGDPPVVAGESGFWTALEPVSTTIDNVSYAKTEVRNLSTGKNLFLWTITNGLCNIDDSVYVELLRDFIPQGFSPNGDSYNNTFIIEGLDLEQEIAELTIVNGAGVTVYSTSNSSGQEWVDWDGRNNKGSELPEGTYYYLLKVTTKDNKVIKKSGFVVLKRY
jgi:gliding motility-associated-like protein